MKNLTEIEQEIKDESLRRYQTTSMSNTIHRENMEMDRKIFCDGAEFGYNAAMSEGKEDSDGFHGKVVGKVKYDPETKKLEIIDLPESAEQGKQTGGCDDFAKGFAEWCSMQGWKHHADFKGNRMIWANDDFTETKTSDQLIEEYKSQPSHPKK